MGHTIGGRTHSFHADASAFGGQLEQPFERIIPAQAPLTLSPDGGYNSARMDYFRGRRTFLFQVCLHSGFRHRQQKTTRAGRH